MSSRVLLIAAILLSLATAAEAQRCVNDAEKTAIHMRKLQTELMVGAISCRAVIPELPDQYNLYVSSHTDRIIANGQALQGYFREAFGRAANDRMDKYFTALANDASTRSMNHPAFCQETMTLAREANKLQGPALDAYARNWATATGRLFDRCQP